jgi:hypothetical protein
MNKGTCLGDAIAFCLQDFCVSVRHVPGAVFYDNEDHFPSPEQFFFMRMTDFM